MRILILARHASYFRNFDPVIRALAGQGHALHLAFERDETIGGSALVDELVSRHPSMTAGEAPRREGDGWAALTTRIRLALDYLRYLEPMFDGTPRLRSRAAERAPLFAERFGASRLARNARARAALRAFLAGAERALPSSPRIEAYLREQRPDVLLITPLIGVVGSPQPDYLRAARALRIPTGLLVWSWDHLSSKALIRDLPDRVFVWNDIQRDEATRLHQVPVSRVVVTGAQCFDQWFGRTPSRSREHFCRDAGLPEDRPYVLYVGSALFAGSPPEAEFTVRWIRALRQSPDAHVRTAAILVRPHPQRMKEWQGLDLSGLGDVAVRGGNPVTDAARADYFDTLAHSAAVVGLNTSAFIEAAIAGRPVLAILPEQYRDNQEGTIHFQYLLSAGGGLLETSRSLDEHVRQLGRVLTHPHRAGAHDAFLRAFVRPYGLDTAATPRFVAAVESLAGVSPEAPREPSRSARACLALVRRVADSPRYRHWLGDDEDRRVHAWRREKAAARARHRRAGLDEDQRAEAEEQMRARRTVP